MIGIETDRLIELASILTEKELGWLLKGSYQSLLDELREESEVKDA